jgi:predicted permease
VSRPAKGHGLLTRFAFTLYRFSLRAYPRAFRARHGRELDAMLNERWNAEIRGRAAVRAVRFWVRMIGLTLLGGFAERLGVGWGTHGSRGVAAGGTPARGSAGGWWRDIVRSTVRAPAISLTTVGMLGVTVGAALALVASFEALLLRPLPFHESDRIVRLEGARILDGERRPGPLSVLDVEEIRVGTPGLRAIAARSAARPVNALVEDRPLPVRAEFVEPAYFEVFGVPAALGRAFSEAEAIDDVVVLAHELWLSAHAGNPSVLGRAVRINERPYTVVGVMPPGFRGDSDQADLWLPMGAARAVYGDGYLDNRRLRWLGGVARLEAGTEIDTWIGAVAALEHRLRGDLPDAYAERGFAVRPIDEAWYGGLRAPAGFVVVASVLAFLLVCLSVSNLVLARSIGRRAEFAVRRTLGADPASLRARLIGEAALLAIGGFAVGVALALLTTPILGAWIARDLDRDVSITVTPLAVLTGAGLAGAAWLAIAVASATPLRGLGFDVLRSGRAAIGPRWGRARRAFVAAQIGIAFVLSASSISLVLHLDALQARDLGFEAEGLHAYQVDVLGSRYATDSIRDLAIHRLARAAEDGYGGGRVAVAGPGGVPTGEMFGFYFRLVDALGQASEDSHLISYHLVSHSYLDIVGGRIAEGRWFGSGDDEQGSGVAVVTRSLAVRYWPGESAIGRTLQMGSGGAHFDVVGVVDDIHYAGWSRTPDLAAPEHVFLPILQVAPESPPRLQILSRGPGGPGPDELRTLVGEIDPLLPLRSGRDVGESLRVQTARERATARLTTGFALLALSLSFLGVLSLVTQEVRTRRREFALRVALGAAPGSITAIIVRFAAGMVGVGLIGGAAAAIALDRVVRQAVFGASLVEPGALGIVAVLLAAAGVVAAAFPARWVLTARPAEALQEG